MDNNKLISKLKERLSKEEADYEAAALPDRVRLNKTQFFSSARKQMQIGRKIAALQTAIEVLEKPIREVNVYEGILMGFPCSREEEREALLKQADSVYLKERVNALKTLFETSLPILKRQVIDLLPS